MRKIKRIWGVTMASYAGGGIILMLLEITLNITLPATLFAAIVASGVFLLASLKLYILIRRREFLTEEDLENPNTKLFWALMGSEYFLAAVIAIGILT